MSEKVRIELLNDGGYWGMDSIKFPVEVEAYPHSFCGEITGYNVPKSEIIAILSDDERPSWVKEDGDDFYWSLMSEECRPL
ncbi:MAG: hypothetical protein ACRCWC_15715 [Plesiomonas shigelloides]